MRPIVLTEAGKSVPIILSHYLNPFSVGIGVTLSGTASYSVEYTYDDIFAASFDANTAQWFTMSGLAVGTNASKDGVLSIPVTAVRLNAASLNGTLTMTVLQAGALGITGPERPTSGLPAAVLELNFLSGTPLDSRITFSRTSNATVTGSNGLIQYAPHNLLTYSEQFDNAAWTKTSATVTANTVTAPDGTLTADKLITDATFSQHRINFTPTSPAVTQTFSAYLKAAGYSFASLRIGLQGGGLIFDLALGTVTSTGSDVGVTASISPAGNGWYRCILTVSSPAANDVCRINALPVLSFADYSGDGTSGIYLWGAQLEIGSTATDYKSTTVKNLLGYTQEFDNAAWTKSNSFVQTNLLLQSEDFSNAAWTKSNIDITANSVTAPDGTLTASKVEVSTTTFARFSRSITSAGSASGNVFSVFVKKGSGATDANSFVLRNDTTAVNLALLYINYDTGVITQTTGTGATAVLSANGFWRIQIPVVSGVSNGDTLQGYVFFTGNIETAGEFAYVWGAQLVQGTSAGDYQRTTSAAAAVQYVAPDGNRSADKLVENTATANHYARQSVTLPAGIVTVSVYAKAFGRSNIRIANASYGQAGYFSLSGAGSVGTLDSATGSITALSDGWYRCSLTFTQSAAVSVAIDVRLASGSGAGSDSYTGDGTSGVYIWGAQVSDSASVDPYIYNPLAAPTTTAAYYGPRFDYDPVTLAARGLLIEEQRTNLLTYSEQFDNAAWNKTANATVTANQATAPDGTTTADLYAGTSAGGNAIFRATGGLTAGGTHTFSVYFKYVSGTWFELLYYDGGSNGSRCWFNLATSTAGTFASFGTGTVVSSSIAAVGNGWYRAVLTGTQPSTAGYVQLCSVSSDGNETPANGSAHIWGAQLEAGAFATSYIPTVAAQVTRAADSAIMTGTNFSSWFNASEGTVYADADWYAFNAARIFSAYNSVNGARLLDVYTDPPSSIVYYKNTNSTQTLIRSGLTASTPTKIALAYKLNDYNGAVGGVLGGADTATGALIAVNTFGIGNWFNQATTYTNGHIRSIRYYNTRLSNPNLREITK
jgi:hypothetical protein